MNNAQIVVVGGGIVGLATAWTLVRQRPGSTITLLEKESDLARHQTGRNSGVIHSGIYYTPGSLKATMCRAGAESIVDFAKEHRVAYEICGKLIVATKESEIPGLLQLYERGKQNDIPVRLIDTDEARTIEPHVQSVKAVQVMSTGIIDYVGICRALAADATRNGVTLRTGVEVRVVAPRTLIEPPKRAIRPLIYTPSVFRLIASPPLTPKPPVALAWVDNAASKVSTPP